MSDATLELVGAQFECSPVVKSSEAQAIDAEQFHIASSHLVDREVVAAPLQEPNAEELSGERTRGGRAGRPLMRLSGMRGSIGLDARRKGEDGAAALATVGRLKRWMNKANQADMQAGDGAADAHARSPSPPPTAGGGLGRERHDSTNFFVHDVGHDGQRMGKPHGMVLGKPLPHAHAHGQDPNHLHPRPALPFLDAINARRRRTSHADHGRGSSSRPRPSASDAPASGLRGSVKACSACRQDVVAGPFNAVTDGAVGSPAFHIDVPTSLDRKAPHRATERHSTSAAHGRGSCTAQRTSWVGGRSEVAGAGAGAGTLAGAATAETLSTSTSSTVAEEQVAEDDVRILMPAAVVSSLRRSAIILSGLSVAFAFYEWVEWQVYRVLVPATAPLLVGTNRHPCYGRTTRWWRSTTSRSCACCCCGWRLRCPSPPSSPSHSRSSRSAASS